MLLSPRRHNFKAVFIRKSLNNKVTRAFLNGGSYGLLAYETGRVSSKQIEAARKYLRGGLKKNAKIWVSVFPSGMVTKKPQEVRMGRGKGYLKYWVHFAQKNEILLEAKGIRSLPIKKALVVAKLKLAIHSSLLAKY
jgi:large subunit ribosomal protein L16